MFMRNRLARKMAAEMREATCAGTQTSKAPTLSGPSVTTNHYSVTRRLTAEYVNKTCILTCILQYLNRKKVLRAKTPMQNVL